MLKNIHFGEISAEVEVEINPRLVSDGFYNYKGILTEILESHKFLVLGNKGTGKSIIGEHVRSLRFFQKNSFLFCTTTNLIQFPYKSFNKIITGSSEPETKFPTTWKWILYIYILKSFAEDNGLETNSYSDFQKTIDAFKQLGLIPAELNKIAIMASKKSFKVKLPFFEGGLEFGSHGSELHFLHIIEYLEKTIKTVRSPNKHFLIIDGLDDILSSREIQYQSLAALISEAHQTNRFLKENNVPFKIIVLCRKDLYRRLPGSNKNKLTKAFSIELDWYEDQVPIEEKEIYKLVLFRSKLSGENEDIFKKYFPYKIKEKHPAEYLLKFTRYTPRDVLQLLNFIKKQEKTNKLTYNQIKSGIKNYSKEYFWPEIEDELDGYNSKEDVIAFKKSLIELNRRQFTLSELCEIASQHSLNATKIQKILETLYECGAISNLFYSNRYPKFQSRLKDDNDFNPGMMIVLHKGMWKALNMG